MRKRIEYQAGVASAWIVNDDDDIVEGLGDRYVGTGTRGQLMKALGVSRMKENLLIAAVVLGIIVFALLMTMR